MFHSDQGTNIFKTKVSTKFFSEIRRDKTVKFQMQHAQIYYSKLLNLNNTQLLFLGKKDINEKLFLPFKLRCNGMFFINKFWCL